MILTLRCEASERIISDQLDRDLVWYERWAVRMHFITCKPCRAFSKHMRFLHDAFSKVATGEAPIQPDLPTELTDSAKQRIKKTLRKA